MAKIRFSEPQGLTHLRLDGFYITVDPDAETQKQKEIFIRGRVGYLDGSTFIAVSKYEERITDQAEINGIITTQVNGQLGAKLERTILDFLISTGRITGTIE